MTQIADGENGGVMMNEFPPKFQQVMSERFCEVKYRLGHETRLLNIGQLQFVACDTCRTCIWAGSK